MSEHEKLRPFVFHGVTFRPFKQGAKDAIALCPFCHSIYEGEQKTGKFNVRISTGQYQCWHCKESGNILTFLDRLHQLSLQQTTTHDYKQLATDRRGVPWQLLRDSGTARRYHPGAHTTGSGGRAEGEGGASEWLLPQHTAHNSICNLTVYRPGQVPLNTAGLPKSLYGLGALNGRGPVLIVEGWWDRLAALRLAKEAEAPGPISVIGLPGFGEGCWKEEWTPLFRNRDLYLCGDNDTAGQEGNEHIFQKLAKTASTIHALQWPSTAPSGTDLRDLVYQELDAQGGSPRSVWRQLQALFSSRKAAPASGEADTPRGPTILRRSFQTVSRDFSKRVFMDGDKYNALAVILATVVSIQLPGDPIWMFKAGPPGSGKTLFLEGLRDNPWCVFRSSIHPAMLISGYQADEDPSLIPQLQGKVLVLKDYTEIVSLPREKQEEIYSILRGAYDGHAIRSFGNGTHRDYPDCHFSMIAGVTDIIHGDDRAALGERFLKYQFVDGRGYDPEAHIRAAIAGMVKQVENEQFLRDVLNAFTDHLVNHILAKGVPQPNDSLINRVVALAQIISHLRTSVPTTYKGELLYRPAPEIGTRIAKQLIKLAQCLAVVFGTPKIDNRCIRIMEKTAFDTARGWGLDIIRVLAERPGAVTRDILIEEAQIPSTTCFRKLDGMLTVGTVVRDRIKGHGAGQPAYGWALSPHLRELWKTARIGR